MPSRTSNVSAPATQVVVLRNPFPSSAARSLTVRFAALVVAHQDSCAHTKTDPHFTFFLNCLRALQRRVRQRSQGERIQLREQFPRQSLMTGPMVIR